MILNLSLDLPEDGQYVRIARLMSTSLLNFMNVIKTDVEDIEFVIGELCSNVARHSHSHEGRFVVSLNFSSDRMEVIVQDNGGGFSFRDVKPVGSLREDADGGQRYGGFGLFLVEMMADHLEFGRTEPNGTTVRAEKILHYASQQDKQNADILNGINVDGKLRIGHP